MSGEADYEYKVVNAPTSLRGSESSAVVVRTLPTMTDCTLKKMAR